MTHRRLLALTVLAVVAFGLAAVPTSSPVPPMPARALALMAGLALATFASEDLACVAAGVLVAQGSLGLAPAAVACAGGIFAGDLALYLAGRHVGRPIVGRWPMTRVLTADRLARASAWLEARGAHVLVGCRFVPGTRVAVYVAAGVLGLDAGRCVRALGFSALVWAPLVVGASSTATRWGTSLAPGDLLSVGLALLVVVLVARHVAGALATHEGRRRVVSWWRRVTRWEFWPAWVLYLPVVVWIAVLAVRYRRPTVFTAANPGIDTGGFVGESKSAILEALARGGAPVAPFTRLRAGDAADRRVAEARRFARAHGLPLVLKPDQGQRGAGVRILRELDALEAATRRMAADHVLQVFVAGPEFGVFYARRPHEAVGRVVSLTAKDMATVVGDGRRPLGRLIVDDRRAVALARVYQAINADRLDVVPAAGERVPICELGTHCRGAIFRDAIGLLTPALERAVDEAARAMPGFAFGRFDVRAESEAAMRAGRFRVLELNGVTSEPTHIYDPGASVFAAWWTLCRTWQLAFAIGHAHAAEGARVSSVRELLGRVLAHRRFARRAARGLGEARLDARLGVADTLPASPVA